MIKKIILTLTIILLIVGCKFLPEESGGSTGVQVTETKILSKIDLTNAKGAVLATQSQVVAYNYEWYNPARYILQAAYAAVGDTTKLFKITDDGYYLDVGFEDASGDIWNTTYNPIMIHQAAANYSAVYFGNIEAEDVYLVNNTSGAVFDIKEYGIPSDAPNYYKNINIFRKSGDFIYYITEDASIFFLGRRVVKFNIINETFSIVSLLTDNVQAFEVDNDGNLIYWGDNNSINVAKLVLADGTISDVPFDSQNYILNFWRGADGKIYYYKPDMTNGFSDIYRIDIIDGNVAYTMTIENTIYDLSSSSDKLILATSDRLVIQHDTPSEYIDITGSTAEMFNNADLGLSTVTIATAGPTSFFFAGENLDGDQTIIKLTRSGAISKMSNLSGEVLSPLYSVSNIIETLSIGEFSTIGIKFISNSNGGIIFNATRIADGQKVIGEISSLGNTNIYRNGSEAETEALVKLK